MTPTVDPPTPSPGPPAVSRFEYNLLRLLRFLLGHMPVEQAGTLVHGTLPQPPCLSRTCIRLVQDTLAKGLVLTLVRGGGWRRERFLRGGQPVAGRAWERTPEEERRLAFSSHTLEFLIWLTAEKPTDAKTAWDAPIEELTAADELFFALAFDALRKVGPEVSRALAAKAVFHQNGLARLFAPAEFAPEVEPPLFDRWLAGPRAAMLECLQPLLAQRWIQSERAKGQLSDWQQMRTRGLAEQATLAAFLAAAEKAGRPDLGRFVLHTAAAILSHSNIEPEFWIGKLRNNRPPRLADRLETERAALAVPRQVETLQRWDRQARAVGYFDEEYAASQLWKTDWEAAHGNELATRAQAVLAMLEPLRTGQA